MKSNRTSLFRPHCRNGQSYGVMYLPLGWNPPSRPDPPLQARPPWLEPPPHPLGRTPPPGWNPPSGPDLPLQARPHLWADPLGLIGDPQRRGLYTESTYQRIPVQPMTNGEANSTTRLRSFQYFKFACNFKLTFVVRCKESAEQLNTAKKKIHSQALFLSLYILDNPVCCRISVASLLSGPS